jgi:hypothetical protein
VFNGYNGFVICDPPEFTRGIFVGTVSPQSKESDERKEEKLDFIIRKLDPEHSESLLKQWKEKYPDK